MKKSQTKLEKVVSRIFVQETKQNISKVLGIHPNTLDHQLKNTDNKVSIYKKYAWLLREYFEFKDDGTEWKWWELTEGD